MNDRTRTPRLRADVVLVERGLAESRTRAQALILAGRVFSGERRIEKAGELVGGDAPLSVRASDDYVSRGGNKLAGALDELGLQVTGWVCVDIGAATGGFTDCLLQRGASKVYAVDVGHGQLAQKLREDMRVVVRERANAKELQATDFAEALDLAVVDVSFIGIGKLLPAIARILRPGAKLLAMMKPQFEAGAREASRGKGVIRDEAVREGAFAEVRAQLAAAGFVVAGECDSRLRGPKGNLERFVLCTRGDALGDS